MESENPSQLKERIKELENENAQLKESEVKYRACYESAPFPYQSLDKDGCFIDVNLNWLKTLGYKKEEVIGEYFGDFLHKDWNPSFEKNFPELKRREYIHNLEYRMKHKKGHYIDVLFEGYVGYYRDGSFRQTYFVFKDISQHVKDREQIASQKERLANIIEGTDAGTWEWNIQTGETFFNERWAKFIGYSLDELSPTTFDTWMKHAHPYDLEKCNKELDRYFKGETKLYRCEHRTKHKDGSWIWLLSRGKVVSWTDDGKPLWMYGTHQNITKRKQTEIKLQKKYDELEATEEELRASNEELKEMNQKYKEQNTELDLYKRMVESSEDMMAVVDTEYNYISVNNAYLNYYQLKREEVIGSEAKKIIGERNFEETVKPNLDRCLAGETVQFEMIREFPEVGKVNLDIIYFPIEINEEIKGVVSAIRDITEHKKAEKELQVKNRISNIFINSEYEGFYKEILDVFRSVFASEYGFFGYINDDEDLVAESMTRDVWDECQTEDKSIIFPQDSWGGLWGQSLKERKTLYKNENLQLPHGHVQLQNAMAAPIVANNKLIGEIALANKKEGYDSEDKKLINRLCDYIAPLMHATIKEEKYKKDLVESKEKAEESDRLKSAFLANMSHEIRTPMNGIMGLSQILQEGDYPKDQQKEFLNIIHSRTQHLLSIINDLVDVSKIEANQLSINPEQFNLNDLMQELHSTYKNQLEKEEKTQIQLKKNLNLNYQESYIESDLQRFRQIMDNLLNNAIKFTDEGTIEFGYNLRDEGTLVFFLKDTGIGIPSDKKDQVFERFRQVDDSLSRAYEGTGLGLTISKNLVELMGGKIWIESKEGEGSVFYFTLPYKSQNKEKEEEPAQEKTDYNWRDKTFLVVEDDPTSLEYMKEILEPVGATLILKQTGEEGYQAFRDNTDIDLILMDIRLPDISGMEIIKRIRETNNNEVTIIAQTAHAMGEDRKLCLQAGADDYIAKPIGVSHLLKIINNYV